MDASNIAYFIGKFVPHTTIRCLSFETAIPLQFEYGIVNPVPFVIALTPAD